MKSALLFLLLCVGCQAQIINGQGEKTLQYPNQKCAAHYPQYCSAGKCDPPECEIYMPDAPSTVVKPSHPHSLFVLEAAILAVAIEENGRAYTAQEYYRNGIEQHHSAGRYAAIHVPLGLGIGFAGWELEKSRHKPLRVLGHGLMWGIIGGYSADYFRR